MPRIIHVVGIVVVSCVLVVAVVTSAQPGKAVLRTLTVKGDFWLFRVAFSPDGRYLLANRGIASNWTAYSPTTGIPDRTIDQVEPRGYREVSFSADGTLCALRSSSSSVKIYGIPGFKLVRTFRDVDVEAGNFWLMPDGRRLLTQNGPKTALWSVETGESQSLGFIQKIKAVSPDGQYVATAPEGCSDGLSPCRIGLVPLASPDAPTSFGAHKSEVKDVAFSPDGKTIASAGADNMVKLWSVPDGKPIRTMEGHDWIVTAVAYLKDGKTLISAGLDQTIRLWDVASGKELSRYTQPGSPFTCMDLSLCVGGKWNRWQTGHRNANASPSSVSWRLHACA